MRMLLDTHSFLWFVLGDMKLTKNARSAIESSDNEKLISPASYWELALKISIGKYTLPQPFDTFIQKAIDDNGFVVLPIKTTHAAKLIDLPFYHRDPFDRLIVAQSIVEQVPIVSGDVLFDRYLTSRIW